MATGKILARDSSGNVVEVDSSDLESGMPGAEGYTPLSSEEVLAFANDFARKEAADSALSKVTAFQAGMERAKTMGGSDDTYSEEDRKSLARLKTDNPWSSLAGEVTPFVVAAPLTGIAGTAAAGSLGLSGGAAAFGGMVLGGAGEAAFAEAGQINSELALGNPELNAEKVLSRIGTSALFGGAVGGLFGLPALRRGGAALKAGTKVDDLSPGLQDRVWGGISGSDPRAMKMLRDSAAGRLKEANPGDFVAAASNPARYDALVKGEYAPRVHRAVMAASDDADAALRAVREAVDAGELVTQRAAVGSADSGILVSEAADLVESLRGVRNHLRSIPGEDASRALRALPDDKLFNSKLGELIEAGDSGGAYRFLDDQYRMLERGVAALPRTNSQIGEVESVLKQMGPEGILGPKGGWEPKGLAAATEIREAQAASSLAMAEARNSLDSVDKVAHYLSDMRNPAHSQRYAQITNLLDARERELLVLKKHGFGSSSVDETLDGIKAARKTIEEDHSRIGMLNELKLASRDAQMADQWSSRAIGFGLGAQFGSPLTGVMAMEALTRPVKFYSALSRLRKFIGSYDDSTAKGVKSLFSVKPPKLKDVARSAAATGAAGWPQKDIHEQVKDLNQPPELLMGNLERSLPDQLEGVAPQTRAAMAVRALKAAEVLRMHAPVAWRHTLTGMEKVELTPSEKSAFRRLVDVVDRGPIALLQHAKAGTLTPQMTEAAAAVYPQAVDELRGYVAATIASMDKVPYRQRVTLGMMFGVVGDPSQEPWNVEQIQSVYETEEEEQGSTPRASREYARGLKNYADQIETQSQRMSGAMDRK